MGSDSATGPGVRIDLAYEQVLRAEGVLRDSEDLAVWRDRLVFIQAKAGYRFGVDAVILARHAAELRKDAESGLSGGPSGLHVLDVGTGCGVIAILLADALPDARVDAIEIQQVMADRAVRNVALNRLEGRVRVIPDDVRSLEPLPDQDGYDLIVSNPPFYRRGTGRINPDGERAIARHEISLDLSGLLAAVARLLKPRGLAVLLYPFERFQECLEAIPVAGLSACCFVPLLPAPGSPPESFLMVVGHGLRFHATGDSGAIRLRELPPMLLSRDVNPA
ncbi:methyltransferase [Myxococcota bacterium]|nr:methyltransferase [Myxococcota bacterium]